MSNDFVISLVEQFNNSSITDLVLEQGDLKLSLKKAGTVVEIPAAEKALVVEKAEKPAETVANISRETIKAPIVGTFYRSPSPDSPAYAEKGTKIKKGEPVCIIEAMKMMNTLNADYDFEVVDVLVQNGDLVEYDQPLFSIKKL